jgi:hypothetical protein
MWRWQAELLLHCDTLVKNPTSPTSRKDGNGRPASSFLHESAIQPDVDCD